MYAILATLKGSPAGGDLLFPTCVVTPWDGTFWLPAPSATSQVDGICVLGRVCMAFYASKKKKRSNMFVSLAAHFSADVLMSIFRMAVGL